MNGKWRPTYFYTMKLILTLLFLPFISFAQEITLNTIDGFTNERTIETSMVTLKQGSSTGFGASYTEANKNYYLNIIGYGSVQTTVTDQDKIWLELEDGSEVKLEYRAQLPYNDSKYNNVYLHHFLVRLDDIEQLKTKKVLLVKIVNQQTTTDVPLRKKDSEKFQKLSDIFLREVSK